MEKIIYNGKIYLQHGKFAQALIINEGRIIKTGTSKELLEMVSSNADKIDADGALVLPAFYDSHLHLMWAGRRAAGVECAGVKSIDEVILLGRETIAKLKPAAGACIQGSGVNPDCFEGEKRDLNRKDLDKISTEHSLVFSRHCGHVIYCNSYALMQAGISESAPEIEGGIIEKDENGKPTGVLRENANAIVRNSVIKMSFEDMKNYLRLGMKKAHSLGITACGSYDSDGTNFENVAGAYMEVYNEYKEAGLPGLRVNMQCGISARDDLLDALLCARIKNLDENPQWGALLKIQSVKLFADGTLGGHTACMKQPYRDNPNTSGFLLMDKDKLNHFTAKAAAAGMQVLIHAIGDAGIDAVLQALEKITGPGSNPLRHGIIHCQITSPDLLERMAHNKILAIVQPAFLADDIHILENRVGKELASTSYAWGSMQRLGIPVSYSTDAPVSSLDPLLSIEWAVLRRNSEDPSSGTFCPDEKVNIYSAVDAYTEVSAFSGFNENFLGRIQPGTYADLVFLDKDIFTIPPEDIHKAKVLKTLCAGETVYQSE